MIPMYIFWDMQIKPNLFSDQHRFNKIYIVVYILTQICYQKILNYFKSKKIKTYDNLALCKLNSVAVFWLGKCIYDLLENSFFL